MDIFEGSQFMVKWDDRVTKELMLYFWGGFSPNVQIRLDPEE